MGDTREGRDKKGHDAEKEQRAEELEDELEYEDDAEKRREEHEAEEAERSMSDDE